MNCPGLPFPVFPAKTLPLCRSCYALHGPGERVEPAAKHNGEAWACPNRITEPETK